MKTAIIGGGIGGLTTALLLSNKGHEVTIYEKSEQLGGRLRFVQHGDFRIDQGPTIVLLPEMIETILQEAGVPRESYELVRCDPLYNIHFADGSHYTKYKDAKKQMQEIADKFPNDLNGFTRFMADMRIRFALGKPNFLEKSFVKSSDFWKPRSLGMLTKLKAYRSVYKQLETYFTDERLRIAYALQTLYVGGNPYSTPAIYSLVSFSEHEHGIYYVKGGYASLVETIEAELRKRNVTIHTNTSVEKVVTTGKTVESILVNGQHVKFDAYILNGDFPVAEQELLGKEKEYTSSSGCLLLYFGLDHQYQDTLMHQFFMGKDFSKSMREIFEDGVIPSSPSYYTFYPSALDSSLAPNGKSVLYTLVPVPAGKGIDWDVEGRKLAETIIDQMELQGFPNLRKHLIWKQIKTPEMARKEGLYHGGSFGIAPSLFQSAVFRPQLKPSTEDNLFAVGASVHPGGGIPIVMQGAKLLSDYIGELEQSTKDRGEVIGVGKNR